MVSVANAILSGLPASALERLASAVAPDDARFKFQLIPKATLERRKKSATRHLTSEEGDRLARLAKVYVFALDIYRDSRNARDFLNRPHAMLDGKPPLMSRWRLAPVPMRSSTCLDVSPMAAAFERVEN